MFLLNKSNLHFSLGNKLPLKTGLRKHAIHQGCLNMALWCEASPFWLTSTVVTLVFTTVCKIYTEWGACKSTQKAFSLEGIGLFETLLRDEIVVWSCSWTEERAGFSMPSNCHVVTLQCDAEISLCQVTEETPLL